MPIRVLSWSRHPHDLLGDAITFLTHGNAQHSAFQDLDGSVVEAYWPKVRRRTLLESEKQFIVPFAIRDITPELELAISKRLALILTHPPEYSGWDLIDFLFNRPNSNENSTFCSRFVQHTCEQELPEELWPCVRAQEADWVSPRDLYISNILVPADFVSSSPLP